MKLKWPLTIKPQIQLNLLLGHVRHLTHPPSNRSMVQNWVQSLVQGLIRKESGKRLLMDLRSRLEMARKRLLAMVFAREMMTDTVLEMRSVVLLVTKRVMEWVPLKGLG